MKLIENLLYFSLGILVVLSVTSCSHIEKATNPERNVAQEDCYKKIKPEYHSYFNNVENCIEK